MMFVFRTLLERNGFNVEVADKGINIRTWAEKRQCYLYRTMDGLCATVFTEASTDYVAKQGSCYAIKAIVKKHSGKYVTRGEQIQKGVVPKKTEIFATIQTKMLPTDSEHDVRSILKSLTLKMY